MTKPMKNTPKKIVNAWAIVERGIFNVFQIFPTKTLAKANTAKAVMGWERDEKIIPCAISYQLPSPKTKKNK